MKKRLYKMTSVILALLILVSCASQGAGSSSSSAAQNENHSAISSEAPKKETSSNPATTDKEKVPSKQPQKEQTTSKPDFERPVSSNVQTSSNESEKTDPKYIKYVMLPDNPAPVKVSRPDAATPTPISYTDTLQNGEALAFNAQTVMSEHDTDRHIAIINSVEELKTVHAKSIDKYDDEFFKTKSIIVLFILDGCYDARHEIKAVTQKDGQMCIYLKNTYNGVLYIFGYFKTFIEVSKDDLKELDNMVVYEEKVMYTTSDGETLYFNEVIYR